MDFHRVFKSKSVFKTSDIEVEGMGFARSIKLAEVAGDEMGAG